MLLAVLVGALVLIVRHQRRRRSALVDRLADAIRELAVVVARREKSDLLGIERGKIILNVDDREVELDLLRVLEIMQNEDVAHRRRQLDWLVVRAESEGRPGA